MTGGERLDGTCRVSTGNGLVVFHCKILGYDEPPVRRLRLSPAD
jgi:hypothetical protein